MDDRTLRIACEVAGLRFHPTPGPWYEINRWKYRQSDPALPAFVASLLWREIPLDMCEYCVYPRSIENSIMACLDVLRPGWREEE